MNEKELGKALLRWDASESSAPVLDAHQITSRILSRDRRRVWRLAGLAIVLWVIVGAGLLVAIYFYLVYLHPQVTANLREGASAEMARTWDMVIRYVAYWLCGVFVLFLLAAFSTVLLVFLSRRATLRQVNASLGEISAQLKQLQDAGPG